MALAQRGFAEIGVGISARRRADIVALAVRNDHKALGLGIFDGLVEGAHAGHTVHFIIGNLHLGAGHHARQRVHNGAVVANERVGRVLKILNLTGKAFRQVRQLCIQTHASGVFAGLNSLDQGVNGQLHKVHPP